MIFNKKAAVSVILSKEGKDGRRHEANVKQESGEHDEYTSHAEDIIAAVKDGSVQRLASALRSYHSMIQADDEAQDARGG